MLVNNRSGNRVHGDRKSAAGPSFLRLFPAFLGVLLVASGLVLGSSAAPTIPTATAAEPVCTISSKLVNSCRPWLGAESGNYGGLGASAFKARMLEHEARTGRQVDLVHAYLAAGALSLSSDMVAMAKRPGTIGLYNWRVSFSWAAASGDNATINSQIDSMATSIKSLGSTKIMLTIHHEPEPNISPGGSSSCPTANLNGTSGTTADYVNMWHNVRERFDALGVSNVVWVMNYTGYVTRHCLTKDLWPGNDYVDWVMWDPYPNTASWTTTVNSFYNYLTSNNDAEHDFLSKPWGLAEFGYAGSSQNAAYAMYDEAARAIANGVHPKLKAYVVWDNWTSSSQDDRVGYTTNHVLDPVEQEHYNAFANNPLLQGTAVPEPTDQSPPTVALTSPEDAATVSGTVSITGTAADDVELGEVHLLVDEDPAGTAAVDAEGDVTLDWNTAAVPNGPHTVRLWARDTSGNTAVSDEVTVTVENTDSEPPTAPSGLSGTWGTPNKVTLEWSGSDDDGAVTGYRVYRDGELVTTLGPAAREYVDTDVANLETYTYAVSAVDAADNESDPSNGVEVVTGDDTPPTTPIAAVALSGPDEAMVTWSESVDNAAVAGYRVYRNGTLHAEVDGTTTVLLDGGLDDASTYSYRVRAYDEAGHTSGLSEPAVVTTEDTTAPTAPTQLTAVSAPASVALTWKVATDNVGVSNYVVYRDGLPVATPGATATSWTDSAPSGNTLHRYRVAARDASSNESARSNEVVRTLSDTTAPSTPTRLARTLSGFTVRLTWTASTDNVGVVGYTIYRGGVAIGTSTTPAYTDSAAPLGRTSTYTVRARDAAGNLSGASASVSAAVPNDTTKPSTPTGLRATVGATGTRQITVSWNASTDNVGVTSYYLYRGNAKYRLLGKVTSFVDTGLRAGTKYTYKVYALDGASNWSSASANISGTAR